MVISKIPKNTKKTQNTNWHKTEKPLIIKGFVLVVLLFYGKKSIITFQYKNSQIYSPATHH
jgi:hypothetical protein